MTNRVRVRYRGVVCSERSRSQGVQNSCWPGEAMSGIESRAAPAPGRPHQMKNQRQGHRLSRQLLPGLHGDSVVFRILRPDSVRVGINALGFEEETARSSCGSSSGPTASSW